MLKNLFAGLVAAVLIAVSSVAATVQTAKPGTETASAGQTALQAKAKKTKRTPPPAQQAMHARLKKYGAEWHAARAAGKTETGMKWPQYWSACNKRLKAGG